MARHSARVWVTRASLSSLAPSTLEVASSWARRRSSVATASASAVRSCALCSVWRWSCSASSCAWARMRAASFSARPTSSAAASCAERRTRAVSSPSAAVSVDSSSTGLAARFSASDRARRSSCSRSALATSSRATCSRKERTSAGSNPRRCVPKVWRATSSGWTRAEDEIVSRSSGMGESLRRCVRRVCKTAPRRRPVSSRVSIASRWARCGRRGPKAGPWRPGRASRPGAGGRPGPGRASGRRRPSGAAPPSISPP